MKKIQLVKESNKKGQILYYVKIDNELVEGSPRTDFEDAMETYKDIKRIYTKQYTVVLMEEEI